MTKHPFFFCYSTGYEMFVALWHVYNGLQSFDFKLSLTGPKMSKTFGARTLCQDSWRMPVPGICKLAFFLLKEGKSGVLKQQKSAPVWHGGCCFMKFKGHFCQQKSSTEIGKNLAIMELSSCRFVFLLRISDPWNLRVFHTNRWIGRWVLKLGPASWFCHNLEVRATWWGARTTYWL